ncbi:MAG: GNAT family N-acetyltransferase [Anaerolineaceae bacterium]|nr:GNAT family N-acetyltransferase [Anaerolineaceae bacterium]
MIIGERVRLRAMEKEDLPAFVRWFNDPEVRRNLKMVQPLSMGQEENWYADMLKRPVDEHPLCIEAKQGEDWVFIGNLGFMRVNQHDRSAEIGISIGEKQFWNQGYGTEAMRLMIRHGFEDLNFNRIYLYVYETNPRGKRCYEKAGFKVDGRLRQARFLEGKYQDVFIMSILKSEWNDKNKIGGNQ